MVNLYDELPDGSTAIDWACVLHPWVSLTGKPYTRVGDPLFCHKCDDVPEVESRWKKPKLTGQ